MLSTPSAAIGLVVGGGFALLGLWMVRTIRSAKTAFIALGSQGINWPLNGDRLLGWNEISAVGISVVWSQAPASNALGSAIVHGTTRNIITRIRIAGLVPGLPHRPDLAAWHSIDEPEPYTHKVVLPQAMRRDLTNLPVKDLVAAALERYAGPKYTGVEERRTFTRRYN
jgi:hypothetical protein